MNKKNICKCAAAVTATDMLAKLFLYIINIYSTILLNYKYKFTLVLFHDLSIYLNYLHKTKLIYIWV